MEKLITPRLVVAATGGTTLLTVIGFAATLDDML